MGTEKCPFCSQEIDTEAAKCFFCGADLSEDSIHQRLEQLHNQDVQSAQRTHKSLFIKVIVILILTCVVFFYGTSSRKRVSDIGVPGRPSTVRLKARVAFPGTQFIVSNKDPFDWKNVKLEIIPDSIIESFKLSVPIILSGETYTAEAFKFRNNDGTTFDPDKMKPRIFRILCDTSTGGGGSYQTNCR